LTDNQLRSFYEEVYRENYQEGSSTFESYERNWVLPSLYDGGHGLALLDLAAGNGITSRFFRSRGYDVSAIEWTSSGVAALQDNGIDALQHDVTVTPYPYPDGTFDDVFWGDNIEHLFFPMKVARELFRVTKPGGRVVVSTPNHGWLVNRLYYLLRGTPRQTEGHILPVWEWQHIRYFNADSLTEFMREAGFTGPSRIYGSARAVPFRQLSRALPGVMSSVLIGEFRRPVRP
jgi:SAM-dependent methyltransferase